MYQFLTTSVATQEHFQELNTERLETLGQRAGYLALHCHNRFPPYYPQTCGDQYEVDASTTWAKERRIGGVALELADGNEDEDLEPDPDDYNAVELAELRTRRLLVIGAQIDNAVKQGPFPGVVIEVFGRSKGSSRIHAKLEERRHRHQAGISKKDPNRPLQDVYAYQAVLPDCDADGKRLAYAADDIRKVLLYFKAFFAVPDTALDGGAAITVGGNPQSVKGYTDMRGNFHTAVDGHGVPFELMVLTKAQYADYLRTHGTYCANRKARKREYSNLAT